MLTLYRLILTLALPVLLAAAAWRRLRGRGVAQEAEQRLGLIPAQPGRPLWLHGASNGEITSARWLIEELLARDPDRPLLITCNNPSARAMVQGWALPPHHRPARPPGTRPAACAASSPGRNRGRW
ncbi:glycosyltransferase N-terminal domain-containing protein [Cereibacter changlensis]|uniref:glycosyltransferase N-terminal domain-containing protein n=1 Tax=Cereibacter changlensis TaxID=402884 RepID=UPI004033F077